jgi:hypothetical protein
MVVEREYYVAMLRIGLLTLFRVIAELFLLCAAQETS